jgi:hypothetical protein
VAEEGVSPDPGLVLRELVELRYDGNYTEVARRLADLAGEPENVRKWRNYVNRWKRRRGAANVHTPETKHMVLLAEVLNEPLDLLRLLYAQDQALREIEQAQQQIEATARALRGPQQ